MQAEPTTIIHEWREGPNGQKLPWVFCHICGKDLTGKRATDIRPMPDGSFSRELRAEECLCDECKSIKDFRIASYKCHVCKRLFLVGENSSTNPTESLASHSYHSINVCPECDPKRKKIYIRTDCCICHKNPKIQILTPHEKERRQYSSQPLYICETCNNKFIRK